MSKISVTAGLAIAVVGLAAAAPTLAQTGHGPPAMASRVAPQISAETVTAHITANADLSSPEVKAALAEVQQIGVQLAASPSPSPADRLALTNRLQALDAQYGH